MDDHQTRALDRRAFLSAGFCGFSAFLGGSLLTGCSGSARSAVFASGPGREVRQGGLSNIANLGPLQPPDQNGVMLPRGFTSRIVARSGMRPTATAHAWHAAPDGGAVFAAPAGGWVYVSNSEMGGGRGGVTALLFDAAGRVVDAYPILTGTVRNCAGGRTPWGTWLSCEETERGRVFECDPLGLLPAVERPAMGVFAHEAAAVDPRHGHVYLTEDRPEGRLYRFVPDHYPDLSAGTLQVAEVVSASAEGPVHWHVVGDPAARTTPTLAQVPASTAFDGGEGIGYHDGAVYFVTKGDNRVWRYDTVTSFVTILYDEKTQRNPILSAVDNVVITADGDVLVAEDGDDLQIVAITPSGAILPVVQLIGHRGSEVTGPAFDPSRQRLYFSSQRGTTRQSTAGITFEITGPFAVPLPAPSGR